MAVDPDAPVAVVDGHALGEHDHTALGGVVGAAALGPLDPLDRGDVDDGAPVRLEHVEQRVLVDQERALQVDVDHAVPLGLVDEVDRPTARDAGAVHDRVEPSVPGDDVGEGVAHRSLVPHVEDVVDALGAVDGRHGGALGRQALHAGRTDAGRRTRHHRDGSLESIHSGSPLSSATGIGAAGPNLRRASAAGQGRPGRRRPTGRRQSVEGRGTSWCWLTSPTRSMKNRRSAKRHVPSSRTNRSW